MFELNQYGKVGGRLFVEFLLVEFGTDVGPCDGMSDGRDAGKLDVLGERYSRARGYKYWS